MCSHLLIQVPSHIITSHLFRWYISIRTYVTLWSPEAPFKRMRERKNTKSIKIYFIFKKILKIRLYIARPTVKTSLWKELPQELILKRADDSQLGSERQMWQMWHIGGRLPNNAPNKCDTTQHGTGAHRDEGSSDSFHFDGICAKKKKRHFVKNKVLPPLSSLS